MNADGSNQRRLTFQGDYNQTPDWSPKGDLIAFTARDERAVFDIFTVRVSDGVIQRLTQNQGNNEEPTCHLMADSWPLSVPARGNLSSTS